MFLIKVTLEANADEEVKDVIAEWRHNQLPSSDSEARCKQTSQGSKHTLTISDVMTEDNGIYSCTLITPSVSDTKRCSLLVQGESLL